MDKLQYELSKQMLREMADNTQKTNMVYQITKYCKIPVLEKPDSTERLYVSLRPKDQVRIIWERTNEHDEYPSAKQITFITQNNIRAYPCWSANKMNTWIQKSASEL